MVASRWIVAGVLVVFAGPTLAEDPFVALDELLESGASYELMRQFYSTSSFNCSIASSGVFVVEDKTFFFFYNRTFTDQVTGFMSWTRKKMGGKMMAKSIREDLMRLQKDLKD